MDQLPPLSPEEILSPPAGPVPPPEPPPVPPSPQSSFVINFVSPKKHWFFPAILIIVFLLLSLPLALILVRQRQEIKPTRAGEGCYDDCAKVCQEKGLLPSSNCLYSSSVVDNCPDGTNLGQLSCLHDNQFCCCKCLPQPTPGPTEIPTQPPPPCGCECDNVVADKDVNNLKVGDAVAFTGSGKTSCSTAISKIKFIVTKNGTVAQAQEIPAVLDHQTGSYRFYKASFSYTLDSAGNYTAAIQVDCPQGWQD